MFVLLIWFFLMRRLNKNARGFNNQFRSGQAIVLAEPLEIETSITKDAFTRANKQLTKSLLSNKWFKFFLWYLGIVVVFNLVGMVDLRHLSLTAASSYLPVIILVLIVPFLLPYLMKKQAEKVYGNTEYLKYPVKYIFNSTGYEYKTPVHSGTGSWETIQGYSITDDFIVVYTSTAQGLFLAKSSFTASSVATFMQFMQANFEFRKTVA